MCLVRFFKQSVQFPTLLKNANQKLWKIIIYFIILILIANFPANFQVVKEQGSKLDFLIEDFSNEIPVNWDLPDDITVKGGKLITNGNTDEYINTFKGKTYIINKQLFMLIQTAMYWKDLIIKDLSLMNIALKRLNLLTEMI